MTERNGFAAEEALRWALAEGDDSAWASADWLAADVDSTCGSATQLLTRNETSLDSLRRSKDVFKTMRMVGETAKDRRLGARLYLASIAAAMVRYNTRISTQSDSALQRSLQSFIADSAMPPSLREMAKSALRRVTPDA